MNKLQYIRNIMPEYAQFQIKTFYKNKWIVMYEYDRYDIDEYIPKPIFYFECTDDLDKSLNEVIDIIMKEKLN